jgi:hypothetical protein
MTYSFLSKLLAVTILAGVLISVLRISDSAIEKTAQNNAPQAGGIVSSSSEIGAAR